MYSNKPDPCSFKIVLITTETDKAMKNAERGRVVRWGGWGGGEQREGGGGERGSLAYMGQAEESILQVCQLTQVKETKAVVSLYFCFHVLNILFACVFSNTLFPGWCKQKLCYSNRCLVTLHSCFPHSPPRSSEPVKMVESF